MYHYHKCNVCGHHLFNEHTCKCGHIQFYKYKENNHISEALNKVWNTIIKLETNSEGYYAWINDLEGTCLCEIDVGLPDLTTVPFRYHTKLQESYRYALKENHLRRLALIEVEENEVAEWEDWYNSTRGV